MRILHTSDWHLGHVLKSQERTEEHQAFLSWLVGTLGEEAIDVVLVTGDVFDGANPPATAQAAWYRFLAEAQGRCPGLQVVVIGGNHDSAARLQAPGPVLAAVRASVVGLLPRTADGSGVDVAKVLIPIRSRGSEKTEGWVAAIPYLRLADLPGGDPARPSAVVEGVQRLHEEILGAARKVRESGHALIVTGHGLLAGTRLSEESERKVLGGNLNPLPTTIYPDDVTYAALGHLHFPQTVAGRENVRYAGSPIPLAIDEDRYPHEVTVVEVEGDRLVRVKGILVPRTVEILRLPEDGPALLPEVLERLRRLPAATPRMGGEPDRRPYLEVRVKVERTNAFQNREIEEALEGKEARLMWITSTRGGEEKPLAATVAEGLSDLKPERVFLELWKGKNEEAPSAEVLAAFGQLVETAYGEEA